MIDKDILIKYIRYCIFHIPGEIKYMFNNLNMHIHSDYDKLEEDGEVSIGLYDYLANFRISVHIHLIDGFMDIASVSNHYKTLYYNRPREIIGYSEFYNKVMVPSGILKIPTDFRV